MDVLLVLGSVTAKYYARIRLAMIREGLDPVVVRIPSSFGWTNFSELADAELENVGFVAPTDEIRDECADRLQSDALRQILDMVGARISDVKAVVIEVSPDESFDEDSTPRYSWDGVEGRIEHFYPRYSLVVRDDGRGYYWVGSGFDSLDGTDLDHKRTASARFNDRRFLDK